MDNNNNNINNASPAAIPPLRPDPPDPPGQAPATTTKSYSAAVGARSAAKHGNASTAVAAHPLMHNIENCVIINTPPSTSVEQVLLALDKHYPALTGAMSCVIKGQRGLRFPKAADLDTLVANGLTIGKTLCKFEDLYSSLKEVLYNAPLRAFSPTQGLRLFDEQIAAYGTVLRRSIQYIGKTKYISGVYDFILALKDVDVFPPASLSIACDGVTERIPLRITGGMRHCVFRPAKR